MSLDYEAKEGLTEAKKFLTNPFCFAGEGTEGGCTNCLQPLYNRNPEVAAVPVLTEKYMCYIIDITRTKAGEKMYIKIDFESEEALYMQLRNQIVIGIAKNIYQEGDSLPSVRQLAEDIGINMHTVNKAYGVLREEGLIRLNRGKGAVIALDIDKWKALDEMRDNLQIVLAKACCKNISREEVHGLVDEIFDEYNLK